MNDIISTHNIEVPPHINSGESLTIKTELIDNGDFKKLGRDENIIINQEITLNSYGNSVTLNLSTSVLTPTFLRELANQLDVEIAKAKVKIISSK